MDVIINRNIRLPLVVPDEMLMSERGKFHWLNSKSLTKYETCKTSYVIDGEMPSIN
jgi:hypothetical protein